MSVLLPHLYWHPSPLVVDLLPVVLLMLQRLAMVMVHATLMTEHVNVMNLIMELIVQVSTNKQENQNYDFLVIHLPQYSFAMYV